jgi:hypothetical protein
MFTLRATAKLRKRLGVKPASTQAAPTTRLGNWYATIIFARPHLVLLVSERTLLPVLVPAREPRGLGPRISAAVAEILRALGVPQPAIETETEAMGDMAVGQTQSRVILGTMNDFLRMLPYELEHAGSLLGASLRLAEAPCGPIQDSPDRATRALFGRIVH